MLWPDAYSGPRTTELLRNTILTLSICGDTLLEVTPLLSDPSFRQDRVNRLPEGLVKDFWNLRFNPLSEKMKRNVAEPIIYRLSALFSSPTIESMVAQKISTINFRKVMDGGKWLIANLPIGSSINIAPLVGTIIVAKLKYAAFSRVDVAEHDRRPFFLFVDEFQNFSKMDFSTILAEARKFALSLIISHQSLHQIDHQLRSAILANTLFQVFFRLSNQDATILAAELGQREKATIQRRLVNLKQREAYFKIKGEPARLIKTAYVPPTKSSKAEISALRELSMSYHARPRHEIEKEVVNRMQRQFNQSINLEKSKKDSTPQNGEFAPSQRFEEFKEW